MNPLRFAYPFSLLVVSCFMVCGNVGTASAQRPFHQDDWIAWGDARTTNDYAVTQDAILIGTSAGVLRLDRLEQTWLTPWFSVPGPAGSAIFLQNVTMVREDPLTRNIYVLLKPGGWYMKLASSEVWEPVQNFGPGVYERIIRIPGSPATPRSGLFPGHPYYIGAEGELTRSWMSWNPSGGIADDRGLIVYGWDGFGLGVTEDYNSALRLYPSGPGPVVGLAVSEQTIWAVGIMDRDGGWLWKRDRNSDHWEVFLPDLEFGLEPATVNRMKYGPNGELWLATDTGVFLLWQDSWHQVRKNRGLPRNEILDIAPVSGGAWVATQFGLAYITTEERAVAHPEREIEPLPATGFFNLVAAYNDTLVAAGPAIMLRHVGEGPWEEIDFPPITGRGKQPSAIFFDQGQFALGDRYGFAWRDSSGQWQELSNTLWRGGSVIALEYHAGLWWLGTDIGLVCVDPETKKVTLFTSREGLPGNAVRVISGEGDWLWLGTDVALVRFYWNSSGRID